MASDKTCKAVSRTERGLRQNLHAILGLGRGVFVNFPAILGLGRGISVSLLAILGLSRRLYFRTVEPRRVRAPECSVWFPRGGLRSHLLLRWRPLYPAISHLAALSLEPLPGSERPASTTPVALTQPSRADSSAALAAPPVRIDDTA